MEGMVVVRGSGVEGEPVHGEPVHGGEGAGGRVEGGVEGMESWGTGGRSVVEEGRETIGRGPRRVRAESLLGAGWLIVGGRDAKGALGGSGAGAGRWSGE